MTGRNDVGKPTAWGRRKQDVASCFLQGNEPASGLDGPKKEYLHFQTIAEKLQERWETVIS